MGTKKGTPQNAFCHTAITRIRKTPDKAGTKSLWWDYCGSNTGPLRCEGVLYVLFDIYSFVFWDCLTIRF